MKVNFEDVTVDMADAAKDAIEVQNASNLCAVVQAFARHMKTVLHAGDEESTRTHPVTLLFMSKLNGMVGRNMDDVPTFVKALHACEALRDGKEPS